LQAFGKSFWWASLVAAIATVGALVGLYEWQGTRLLIAAETRADVQTVRTLGNVIWPNYGSFLTEASSLSNEELTRRPEREALYAEIRSATRDLPVLKVKLFSADTGRVLFSTEAKQIGDLKDALHALNVVRLGREQTDLSFRSTFNSIRGVVKDRHVLGTYVPYYAEGLTETTKKPSVVVEIYSDVTDRIEGHKQSKLAIVSGVSLTIFLVYIGVFLIGRRASKALVDAGKAQREQEEKILHQAFHDALTTLPNRAGLNKFFHEFIGKPKPKSLALLSIDINRFKSINASYGQAAGDQVLQQTADRLLGFVDKNESVFRNGGNEFLVMLHFDDDTRLQDRVKSLLTFLHKQFVVDGGDINATVSIGVALWPQDHTQLEQVQRYADLAKNYVKTEQLSHTEFYRLSMSKSHDQQTLVMTGLQKALELDEFVLHYQPRLSSGGRKIESVEALIRWQHPTMGLLPPARFIEVLEDSPLIVDVGSWVLEAACRQTMRWQQLGYTNLKVSVNVAARQFRQTNFIDSVLIALQQSGLSPHCLELELTEGQLMSDLESASKTLNALRAIGVSVSIDDFGTGYSSLSYLHRLPIDCLKIDRSFVMSITEDHRRSSIAKTITMLGHSLDMKVVAEGVETKEQADLLTSWGCGQLQGYYFSKPVDDNAITALLKKQGESEDRRNAYQETVVQRTDSGVKVEIAYSD
jgi:diguanylate cyclase (GGDEF)-like protein